MTWSVPTSIAQLVDKLYSLLYSSYRYNFDMLISVLYYEQFTFGNGPTFWVHLECRWITGIFLLHSYWLNEFLNPIIQTTSMQNILTVKPFISEIIIINCGVIILLLYILCDITMNWASVMTWSLTPALWPNTNFTINNLVTDSNVCFWRHE